MSSLVCNLRLLGWLTVCGWQANTASGAALSAALIQGMAIVANPDYVPQPYHYVLISWAVTAFAAFVNLRGGKFLPRFEATILLLHIFGFFAALLPLVTIAKKQDTSFVFESFNNGGGFPTQGLSFMVGSLGMLWTFSGADGAIHMSEEIENAPLVVPRSILATYILNGVLGFAMLVAVLFCIQDLDAALSDPTGYAFIQIFQSATGSTGGTVVIIALLAVMEVCATTSSLAAASRQFWSFSRDHGIPGWSFFLKIEQKSSVPIYAVGFTSLLSILLSLINFGSSLVFQDLVSVAIAGLYSSYLVATCLLLYRRLNGTIKPFNSVDTEKEAVNTTGATLMWGPWHIPGYLGIGLNIFVCCFLCVSWFFSFWPTAMQVTPATMNYNALLWGAVVLFSLIYYIIRGKKEYNGPIIESGDDVFEPGVYPMESRDKYQ
jgi:choline transport protein